MIYEIICNETGERYIGSTFEPTLARRLAKHKEQLQPYFKDRKPCRSYQILLRDNYYINLLEKIDTTNRDELRMSERKWFDKLPNINRCRPYITEEEHKEQYRLWERTNEKRIERNRQKNLARDTTPIECDKCGGCYTLSNKSYHMKSKKHLGN